MYHNIFIKKNLEILLLSIDSLDPYITDSLTLFSNSNILNLLELFSFRAQNRTRQKKSLQFYTLYTSLTIIQNISKIFCNRAIQRNIKIILIEYINCYSFTITTPTTNYFNKFRINYIKSFKVYLKRYINSNYNKQINHTGLMNLYVLYKLNTDQGIYVLLAYLMLKI